jgi:uncharacterized protein (TIGR02145 family)
MVGYLNSALQRIPVIQPCQGYYLRWYFTGWHYWFFLPGTITTTTEGEEYRTIGTKKLALSSGQITREQAVAIRSILYTREIQILTDIGWKNLRIEDGSVIIYDFQVTGVQIDFVGLIGSRMASAIGYTPIPVVIPPGPEPIVCTLLCIGTQAWTCKNYDSDYPGSKTYNNITVNRNIYGGLYTWNQVTSSGFCPVGYHIPSLVELATLLGVTGSNAGRKLKEAGITHWSVSGGTNDYNFSGVGAGGNFGGIFIGLKNVCNFWLSDSVGGNAYYFQLKSDDPEVLIGDLPKTDYISVRFIRDTSCGIYSGYGALYNWFAAKGII